MFCYFFIWFLLILNKEKEYQSFQSSALIGKAWA